MENEKLNTKKSPETLDQLESRINSEVADFFETELLKPNIRIFNSKTELDKFLIQNSEGKSTEVPDWVVASAAGKNNNISILSPEVMPEGMDGPGYERFTKILKHEIGHLYSRKLNNQLPTWLNEGISSYIAGQNYHKKMDHEELSLSLLNELENAGNDPRIYQVGYNMAKALVDLGGKKLLLEVAAVEDKGDRDVILLDLLHWLK